jgi:hypothetical protein
VRLPWQTREDTVLALIDVALVAAERARRDHEEALRRLRDALPKDDDDDT